MNERHSAEPYVEVGTFLAVYVGGDSCYHVLEHHWDEIDGALTHYAERGINRLLTLTLTCGTEIMLPAGRVTEVLRSTPASRERTREIEAALKAESGFEE